MKKSISTALLFVFLLAPGVPLETLHAQDRERLSSRATQAYRRVARNLAREQARRPARPIQRIRLNNTVYRYEGNPNIRHDEASSPEVIFHFQNRRVVPGHAWDR